MSDITEHDIKQYRTCLYDREYWALYYLLVRKMTRKEIALLFNRSVATVTSVINRAKNKIREAQNRDFIDSHSGEIYEMFESFTPTSETYARVHEIIDLWPDIEQTLRDIDTDYNGWGFCAFSPVREAWHAHH